MRGNVYRTMDFGATWQKIETGTTASLMSGRQLADGRVLLVGNTGLVVRAPTTAARCTCCGRPKVTDSPR